MGATSWPWAWPSPWPARPWPWPRWPAAPWRPACARPCPRPRRWPAAWPPPRSAGRPWPARRPPCRCRSRPGTARCWGGRCRGSRGSARRAGCASRRRRPGRRGPSWRPCASGGSSRPWCGSAPISGWPARPGKVCRSPSCACCGVRDRGSLAQAHPAQLPGGHAGQLLHHPAGLLELLEQGVDLLGGGARALGDAGPAGAVEDRGGGALTGGHGADDGHDAGHVAVVDLDALELLAHPREHAEDLAERAHLLDLLELVEEVLQGEGGLAELALHLLGLLAVDLLLGPLDQGEDVA